MMMTEIITIGVMLGIFIAMVVVNYRQMKRIKAQSWKNFLEINSQINKHLKHSANARIEIIRDFADFSKRLEDQIVRIDKSMDISTKNIEEFIELVDSDYKKQIKQLEVNERFATKQLTEYYMAVRSLDDNYKKKIQFRLDKMLNKKDGKDKRIPITKTNGGK